MSILELSLQPYITYCTCNVCYLFSARGHSLSIYRVGSSDYHIRELDGRLTYWIGCPRNIDSQPSNFDEMLSNLDSSTQTDVLFNINLFRK